jgi:ribosome-interacting GTPase 1
MPTNLPPEYFEAEKRFKQASAVQQKIEALEELISTVPKHKGTDKLRADLRKRLSKLRVEGARKKKSGGRDLFAVDRQGAAQAALVGFANSGKSSLLGSLTNAHPVIADYPMSTMLPLAGMMPFEDIQFQLVDLPPIGNESTDGPVSGILRIADLSLLVLDLTEEPTVQAQLLLDQLVSWKIPCAAGDRVRQKAKAIIVVGNKSDVAGAAEKFQVINSQYSSRYPAVMVSNKTGEGLDALRRLVFEFSGIIRVYSKEPGKQAEMEKPHTLPSGSTVLDFAELIHKDFVGNLKYACIWGSAKFDGQRVQRDYALHDRDIVELHVK